MRIFVFFIVVLLAGCAITPPPAVQVGEEKSAVVSRLGEPDDSICETKKSGTVEWYCYYYRDLFGPWPDNGMRVIKIVNGKVESFADRK